MSEIMLERLLGESGSNWIIDNFRLTRIGSIYFPEKGIYKIEIDIKTVTNKEVRFQWLWLR